VRFLFLLALCFLPLWSAGQTVRLETTVVPRAGEDIASDCHYSLTITTPSHPISAVWVIFDRSHDVHDLYRDEAVLAFARRFHLALLLHGHCPGKTPEDNGDMNMDPSRGLGRALFTALAQFADSSGHRELSNARFIFLGFSGAGPLSARLVGLAPERTVAAILSSPGHYDPLGIDTVALSGKAWTVPELVLTGSADDVSGTARPYRYFRRYRDQGAPWAFVVQNSSPHCCTANAKRLILDWLQAVIKRRQLGSPDTALREMDQSTGWLAFIQTRETSTKDSFGQTTFKVVSARIQASKQKSSEEMEPSGWLPTRSIANQWLSFVRMKTHPVLPLR
jgi:dienelactone hydrolase